MYIQYASDLHIEDFPWDTPFMEFITPTPAPLLILAGDICPVVNPRFAEFLAWASAHWRHVIFVPGNHEYHNYEGLCMRTIEAMIDRICRRLKNVIFLQRGASTLIPNSNIRVVGATLWSAVDKKLWHASGHKKDCRLIVGDSGYPMKPWEFLVRHDGHSSAIARAIDKPWIPKEELVVVTHHLPTKKLLEPEFQGETWHSFYASNDDVLFKPQVKAWICGHGHRSASYVAPSGTYVTMNARGSKPHELTRTIDVYDPAAVLKIEPRRGPWR